MATHSDVRHRPGGGTGVRPQRPATGQPIAVSACLLGVRCRYDGGHRKNDAVLAYVKGRTVIPVCPERSARLPVPRPPSRFSSGDGRDVLSRRAAVVNDRGEDLTERFLAGAGRALAAVKRAHADSALLKERSPSCGVCRVYDGSGLREGLGVFSALLREEGVAIFSEEQIPSEDRRVRTGRARRRRRALGTRP